MNEALKLDDYILKKNDLIDLVAPSSKINQLEYNAILDYIKNIGLNARVKKIEDLIGNNILYANDNISRFKNLEDALYNDESKIVWCMKAGHGATHLLDKLAALPKPKNKKLFIGFSDVTSLINFFIEKWNWPCLYAANINQIIAGDIVAKSVEEIENILFGRKTKFEYKNIIALNDSANNVKNDITGKLVGGCLAIIQALIGTPEEFSCKDKVILLEDDRFETAERIDRIFNHFVRSNFLDGTKSIILGDFLENEVLDITKKEQLDYVINEFAKKMDILNIPLWHIKNLGHSKHMEAIPLGMNVVLNRNLLRI